MLVPVFNTCWLCECQLSDNLMLITHFFVLFIPWLNTSIWLRQLLSLKEIELWEEIKWILKRKWIAKWSKPPLQAIKQKCCDHSTVVSDIVTRAIGTVLTFRKHSILFRITFIYLLSVVTSVYRCQIFTIYINSSKPQALETILGLFLQTTVFHPNWGL